MQSIIILLLLLLMVVTIILILLPSSPIKRIKNTNKNINNSITQNMPLAMSVRRGKNLTITNASGSILSEFEDLIGKDPSEALPIQIYNALNAAIEEAFDGRVTNKIAVINGASYSLSVKPVINNNSKSVSEVISVAVEADKPRYDTLVKPNNAIMVIYLQIEGINTVEEALGRDSTYQLLTYMEQVISEKIRPDDTMINMENGSYMIFIQHAKQKEFVNNMLNEILHGMCSPVIVDGYEITMPVNHKLVIFSEDN